MDRVSAQKKRGKVNCLTSRQLLVQVEMLCFDLLLLLLLLTLLINVKHLHTVEFPSHSKFNVIFNVMDIGHG